MEHIADSRKPRIFVSSTIYDFHDLRSSLKYWLEQLGYDVFLSEFNDFPKPLDVNSFTAALATLQTCDYYILLVGSRTGALFDGPSKISVTRQEYRTAYELLKQRKQRIVLFVRSTLWDIRRDREALRSYLENEFRLRKELRADDVKAIVHHQGEFANDAEVLFSFLGEIGRELELRQAVEGKAEFPIGNWVHAFSGFEEIVQVLQNELRFRDDLAKVALSINLKRELAANLTVLLQRTNGDVQTLSMFGEPARRSASGGVKETSTIKVRHLKWLKMYLIIKPNAANLATLALDQALSSGIFLEFSRDDGAYRSGKIVECLVLLRSEVSRLLRMEPNVGAKEIVMLERYTNGRSDTQSLRVKNWDLVPVFGYFDCAERIFRLTVALLQALDGDKAVLDHIDLGPKYPFDEQTEGVALQDVSVSEVDEWLARQARQTAISPHR